MKRIAFSTALIFLSFLLLAGCGGGGGGGANPAPPPQVGVTVSGTIKTSDTQQPVENAVVSIPEQGKSDTTNGQGQFEITDVSPGTVTLEVTNTEETDPQISSYSEEIVVGEDDITLPTISVPPAETPEPENNEPVISGFSCSPASGVYPLVTNCVCAGADPDPGDVLSYNFSETPGSWASVGQASGNFSRTYTTAGTRTLTCVVRDNHGAESDASTFRVSVTTPPEPPPVNHAPVIISFTAEPQSGDRPLKVDFLVLATDQDGDPKTYDWDFGDGETLIGSSSASLSHTYTSAGNYTAQVTVKDGKGGEDSETVEIHVTNPPPPTNNAPSLASVACNPSFGYLISGSFKTSCEPSGASDPDAGDTVTCSFDFGDGTILADQSCTSATEHTYVSAGNFTVTVTPKDNRGLSGASKDASVAVQNPPTAPSYVGKWGSWGTGDTQFKGPYQVVIGSDNRVYVADFNNKVAKAFSSTGAPIKTYGSGLITTNAVGVDVIDSLNRVYIADMTNSQIVVVDKTTGNQVDTIGQAGDDDGEFFHVGCIAHDSQNNIYAVDQKGTPGGVHHRIQVFDSDGNFLRQFGTYGSGDGELYEPYCLALDSDDNVYVTDYQNNRVQKFTSAGEWIRTITAHTDFFLPIGIAIDQRRNILYVDTGLGYIEAFSLDGNYLFTIGLFGTGNGEFSGVVSGIAVAVDGTVYAADGAANRIQYFK